MNKFNKVFPIKCSDTKEVCYTYNEYLQSKHWQILKSKYYSSALFRSKHAFGGISCKCVCCKVPNKPLELHHITYKRLGREKLWDLIPLCRECHDLSHQLTSTLRKFNKNSTKFLRRSWKRIRKKKGFSS